MTSHGRTERLVLPGVLTADEAAETIRGIAAIQRPDGAIPWFAGGHLDPWDHVESAMALDAAGEHERAAAAYRWLALHQNQDGSWYAAYSYADGARGTPSDRSRETNFCAYIAVGIWHHYLSTSDETFLDAMWPHLFAAVEFVLELQLPGGQIAWKREDDGSHTHHALLTGCCSIYQALRCALAVAEQRGEPQPDWELAVGRLGHAILRRPERFLDKSGYSMDWYYPVLGTVMRGPEAKERIESAWDRFVVPGLGVRCVDDHPWVTGGESAELALALWALGESDRAVEILASIRHLRAADGMYWTGYVYKDDAVWPEERTSWTAGALLLAVAALGGDEATTAVFDGGQLPVGLVDPPEFRVHEGD